MKKVIALMFAAAMFVACSQEEVDEEAVEQDVDSTANELLDELNAGFEEEETADESTPADSMADAAMNEVMDEE